MVEGTFVRILILSMVLVPGMVSANDWSRKYDRPSCSSTDDPTGDVKLQCDESETVKALKVSVPKEKLSEGGYKATVVVENTNSYPVLVKTILADGINKKGQVIDFCSKSVKEPLVPGSKFTYELGCQFQLSTMEQIVSVKVRASPW